MTPRERAEALERQLWDTTNQTEDVGLIEHAIIAAVEEEREYIARMIDMADYVSLTELAQWVRSRGNGGKEAK